MVDAYVERLLEEFTGNESPLTGAADPTAEPAAGDGLYL